MTDSRVRLYVV